MPPPSAARDASAWRPPGEGASVVVEAAAGLLAQLPLLDEVAEQRRRLVPRVLRERLAEYLADREQRVEPDQVREGERPHRVGEPEPHRGVDVLAAGEAGRVEADRVEE